MTASGPQRALVFDIDNTLTPPRDVLRREMADLLGSLPLTFAVAAGSDLGLTREQFFEPLWKHGFRGDFDAFLCNGASHFHCTSRDRLSVQAVREFDFRAHLGHADFQRLMREIEATLAAPEFALPPHLGVDGERVIHRGSMINVAPIGRPAGSLSNTHFTNRAAFVEHDRQTGYRAGMLKHFHAVLGSLLRDKGVVVTLGGETSFDFVVRGYDKSLALRFLLEKGYRNVTFIGDALFSGGNDAAILDFVAGWTGPGPCPVDTVRVNGWTETAALLRDRYL
jgi:phosphomannomutase